MPKRLLNKTGLRVFFEIPGVDVNTQTDLINDKFADLPIFSLIEVDTHVNLNHNRFDRPAAKAG